MRVPATTWQTVGPFFRIGLERLYRCEIADETEPGERITVRGRLLDGDLSSIPDAVFEIWQANAAGEYGRDGFRGYGRVPTDGHGCFSFSSIKPGVVSGLNGAQQAPHLVVGLMMRGLLKRLVTRMYFPDESLNTTDSVLQSIEPARRKTLLLTSDPLVPGCFTWNIHMQGADETVFFDF